MIKFYDQINNTPALALATKGHAALMADGLGESLVAIEWDHKALVYFEMGNPLAVLTFSHFAFQKRIFVGIGYVEPTFRRRGIYRQLWESLVMTARELKVVEIIGGTNVKNTKMQDVASALGRTLSTLWYRYEMEVDPGE